MRYHRRFLAVLAAFGTILSCSAIHAAAPQGIAAATGDAAPELDVAAWVQGGEVKLSALKGKKCAVLFFWTVSRKGTQDFPELAQLSKKYGKDAAFIGIGIDSADAIRNLVRLQKLPFPVAADDKLTSVNLYMRQRDQVPMVALIGKDGRLLWRGRPKMLEPVLKEVLSGKFDLKGSIEREQFAHSVMTAMKLRDYPAVLKLLNAELAVYPDNFKLVALKVRLLASLMNKPDEAFAYLNTVIARHPKELPLYEIAIAILKELHREGELGGWDDRIVANFGDQPVILVKLAEEEMKYPVQELRLENVLKLCRAAYHAPHFKNNLEQGFVADQYARILYYCGCPDKALEVAKKAMVLLQGTHGYDKAKASVIYYTRVLVLSKQIQKNF